MTLVSIRRGGVVGGVTRKRKDDTLNRIRLKGRTLRGG